MNIDVINSTRNSQKNESLFSHRLFSYSNLSIVRACISHRYNLLPKSVRSIFDIPVSTVQTASSWIFPSILFTEGTKVLQNFGFSWNKMTNNFLLASMLGFTFASFYINPWYYEKNSEVFKHLDNMSNHEMPDEEFYTILYTLLWDFTKVLSLYTLLSALNSISESLLVRSIVLKKQYQFIQDWLTNFSIYDFKMSDLLSTAGMDKDDKERENLTPVTLFQDLKTQTAIVSLWNFRIRSAIDFYTACNVIFSETPYMSIPTPFGGINLPVLIVVGSLYSSTKNILLSSFDRPMQRIMKKMNQLSDKIINQISGVHNYAELITFLDGEEYEIKKLLNLLKLENKESLKYDLLSFMKGLISSIDSNISMFLPYFVFLKSVRSGLMERSQAITSFNYYFSISHFLNWFSNTDVERKLIEEGLRRQKIYQESRQTWELIRTEMESKIKDSEKIGFSGYIYADKKKTTLLAKGEFELEPGSITHFDAPSGCGKTTLFRVFRRIWGAIDIDQGYCSLPKNKSIFIPSQVYVLDSQEPLFQTVCYPFKHGDNTKNLIEQKKWEHLNLVKTWFQQLNLPDHIFNNLQKLPRKDKKSNEESTNNWVVSLSEGERKRVFLCNMLLKLYTQDKDIKFLVMDEPFKGVDFKTQKIMVNFLKVLHKKTNCTILYSNHEYNHDFNTHRLTVDPDSKEYSISKI